MFDVRSIVASGALVAVYLRIESTVRTNGRPLKNEAVHRRSFNDAGQIARHFNDPAAERAARRGPPPPSRRRDVSRA